MHIPSLEMYTPHLYISSLFCCFLAATGVRDYLHQIRKEFEALVAENAAKPEAERLPRSAFEVDIGLREMIAEVDAC